MTLFRRLHNRHAQPGDGQGASPPDTPESFPQRYARTQRFTLGQPRGVTVAPDGSQVVFLRSTGGEDPATRLWVLDVATGTERVVAQPSPTAAEDLPPEEQARRERRRESAGGIVAYATDRQVTTASFALGGYAYVCDLANAVVTSLPVGQGVVDPRVDPSGTRVAFVRDGALRVVDIEAAPIRPDTSVDTLLLADDDPDVTYGLAEFIAAEEMGRHRGYWWAPDGKRLAVARVDNGPVERWHIADPAHPQRPPALVPYPAAGAANADVRLVVTDLRRNVVEIGWDRAAFPYLVEVVWSEHGPLTLVVQSRDQRSLRTLETDPERGTTTIKRDDHDRFWLQLVPGTPRWLPGGRLLHTLEHGGARRVAIDGEPLLPASVQVRRVAQVTAEAVVVIGSTDPTTTSVWRVALDSPGEADELTPGPGLHDAAAGAGTVVVQSRALERSGVATRVSAGRIEIEIVSHAAAPGIDVNVELVTLGERQLRCALVLPNGYDPSKGRLPVLLDPYGGPGAQRVLAGRDAYLQSQWFADQGFAVLIVDGRGTPGRDLAWEHAVAGDLAGPVLEDQVDALDEAARRYPFFDLDRVAVRGWSFGGYLAALAVLRRPDLFHAAIAGAPVTDWRLYDTHYTERYLGQPDHTEPDQRHGGPEAYDRTSLLNEAHLLRRPLLLIHGLADDNVVAAHTLQFSNALLEAGRPHQVLPLTSVTHMASQATVAENLLHLQLAFLTDAL